MAQGYVEQIDKRQGSTNGKNWTLNILTIDGQKYSIFGAVKVEQSDFVNFEWKQDGKYRKLTSIEKAEAPAPTATSGGEKKDSGYSSPREKEERIARQSSLKAAIEIMSAGLDYNSVMVLAEALTKYVMGGMSEEEFEAQMGAILNTEEKKEGTEEEDPI